MAAKKSIASMSTLQRCLQTIAPLTLLVILLLVLHWQTEGKMIASGNLRNVVVRNIPLALIAIGETVVIIAGHIDLGVGSVMALAAVSGGLLVNRGVPFPAAVAIAVAVGVGCGMINGLVTTKAKMPSFVVTLAMMGLARGVALVITDAQTVSGEFGFMGDIINNRVLGLPTGIWLLLAVAALVHTALAYTVFGRGIYALGANTQAAHLSGIRTDRTLTWLFVIEGALVGLAGLVNMMQNASAEPTMAGGIELDAIAAVVIGGASLSGGQGSVGGTLVGVAIMAVLINGCNLLDVPNQWSKVIIAPLIVIAVLYDRWLKSKTRAA
ncbi:MAG: ABC transporter permease [Armatimonadetes bacterium]|nr:ABC transporter permease [Armatimonadota bacterium]